MKILPLVKDIKNDIASSSVRLKKATVDGYRIADRSSKVYGQGYLRKYYNATKIVTGKIVKGTTMHEMPYVVGAIGVMMPIPFTGPILLGLGFLARFSAPRARNIYEKLIKSNHVDI